MNKQIDSETFYVSIGNYRCWEGSSIVLQLKVSGLMLLSPPGLFFSICETLGK